MDKAGFSGPGISYQLIEDHESGHALVDEATLKKSRMIVEFYKRTVRGYEEQCKRREDALP